MSLRAMLWALNDAPVTNPTNAFVLVALADNAWDDGRGAFPSVPTIAERARVSERTVQRSLRSLEDDGIIWRAEDQSPAAPYAHQGSAPTVYELDLTRIRPKKDGAASSQVKKGDNLSPLKSEPVDNSAKGDNDDALRVTPVSPEPKPLTKNPFASVGGVSNHAREAEKPTPEDLPNHDEYGRTTADCDRHVGNPTDDPCKACGTARVEFQASAARRDEARDRIKAAGRRAEWQVPVNEVADVPAAIAAAKAALRGRKRRAESEAQARRASAIGGAA